MSASEKEKEERPGGDREAPHVSRGDEDGPQRPVRRRWWKDREVILAIWNTAVAVWNTMTRWI